MSLLRFTVDIEAADDVTASTLDEMADKVAKYADSVVGPQYLGEKHGDDKNITYHVHRSTDSYACSDCIDNSQDERI